MLDASLSHSEDPDCSKGVVAFSHFKPGALPGLNLFRVDSTVLMEQSDVACIAL